MTLVAHLLVAMVTASMIVVVVAVAMDVMTRIAIVDPVVMIVVTEAMDAVIGTKVTHLEVSTAMVVDGMTATAEAAMTDVEEAEGTLIAMTGVNAMVDGHPEMSLQQPPMVILLLVERGGNHTEVVDFTMQRTIPVVAIDR